MALIVDARQAGISGDMMLSALVDIGVDGDTICQNVQKCAKYLDGSSIKHISFQKTKRSHIKCTRLNLETKDSHSRPASEMVSAIAKSVKYMKLSKPAQAFANGTIGILASTESKTHDATPESTNFHEMSSIDTLIDIAGTAMALDVINAFRDDIIITPVNVGGGTVKFAHGTMSNPAPATLQILSDARIPMFGGPANMETATPTGAAILAGLHGIIRPFYPHIVANRIGYGAGSHNAKDFANMLSLVQGDSYNKTESSPLYDTICVVETNIDDTSGEIVGNTISTLMDSGAIDVTAHTRIGKKGRPVYVISVMCRQKDVNRITDTLISQTKTLGVRLTTTQRYTIPRQSHVITVLIDDTKYRFRYKSHTHKNTTDFKIEFDDITKVSAETGINIHNLERMVRRHIEKHT